MATVIVHLRLDAHLCLPAPPRSHHQTGRPCLVGARLPTLATYANAPTTAWTTHTLARWYGERDRPIQLLSVTAVWYHTGVPPVPIHWVLNHNPLGKFATQAVMCTDLAVDPLQIVCWFILRWQLNVTFREIRAHLGVKTQRQWFDRAIARTTSALLGLFSFVTLLAHDLLPAGSTFPCSQSTWYSKPLLTFLDALALVRCHLWTRTTFPTSHTDADLVKVPAAPVEHLHDLLCYAA